MLSLSKHPSPHPLFAFVLRQPRLKATSQASPLPMHLSLIALVVRDYDEAIEPTIEPRGAA
jgi:hypothetical protein